MQHFTWPDTKGEMSHFLCFALRLEGRGLQSTFQAGTGYKSCTKTINSAFTGCTEKSIMWTWLMAWDACNAQRRRSGCITRIHPSILKCLWNLARKGETNQNIVKSLRCSTLFNISGRCSETEVAHCCLLGQERSCCSFLMGWLKAVTSGKQQEEKRGWKQKNGSIWGYSHSSHAACSQNNSVLQNI